MNYDLKVMACQGAEAARLARKMSRSLRSKIDRKQGTNQLKGLDNLNEEFLVWSRHRIEVRKLNRIIHLTRAYFSGKDYFSVENMTHNPVNEVDLWVEISSFDHKVSRQDVERWLYAAD